MEKLIEALLKEVAVERAFYQRDPELFDVEERAMYALNMVLLKTLARLAEEN